MSARITEALQEALKLCSLADTMTACRGDDDFISGVKAKIEAALSTEPGEAERWKPIEAWAVFYDGRLTTLTDRLEVAEAYRRTGILEVRQVAAAPLPEESRHGQ